MKSIHTFVLSALLLLVFAGCNPAQYGAFAIQPAALDSAQQPGNRIVVQGFDGNIFTLNSDGGARLNLTTDATPRRQYQQPTWSPDAAMIALARVDNLGSRSAGALVTAAHDGSTKAELQLPFPPFYMNWSPTGTQIAYLSNWSGLEGPSMALRLFDVAANTADTVAEGSPYYFSWAPDGSQLLAHIGANRLELQDAAGVRRAFLNTSAGFAAPQWANDGVSLVYAVDDEQGQRVVIGNLEGVTLSEITDFDERISFALSPNGEQLAYVLTPAASQVNTLGPLYLTDVQTQRTRELTDQPVWAIFWSPDGDKLAWVASVQTQDRLWLRWFVWDGARTTAYSRFLPTRTFLENYLVFSDQYAQSMRIWSPDSNAFVYAGTNTEDKPGVWVQRLDAQEAKWIGTGVFAAWSPR